MPAVPGAEPAIHDLPDAIRAVLEGAETIPRVTPAGGVRHDLAFWPDGRVLHIDVASADDAEGVARLQAEHDRLGWFDGRLPVATVVAAAPGVLVTRPPAGTPGTELVHHVEVEALIRSFAAALRRVHELPVDGCPFARGVDHQLATVSARVERGAIDASRLAPAYQRYAPPRLLELLVASRPAGDEDLVVVHGSYGLGGVHLEHGAVTGYADVGRAGVADRYVDLAIAARELAHTISPEALGPFFVEYGIDYPDLRKIDFYVLLDELV